MRAALAVLVALVVGCHEAPRRELPPRERASAMQEGNLATAPVSGHLAGRPYRLRAAWYRVVRRAGHERIDLFLSEGRASRLCGRPTPSSARQVLVRIPGARALTAGASRITATTTSMLVSYEAPAEHGFEGVGGGEALVVFDVVEGAAVTGRMRACFPDEHGSCVDGTFRAEECRDELDFDGPRGGGAHR